MGKLPLKAAVLVRMAEEELPSGSTRPCNFAAGVKQLEMKIDIFARKDFAWQINGDMAQFFKAELVKHPGGLLGRAHEYRQGERKNRGTILIEVKPSIGKNNGKQATGHGFFNAAKTAAVAGAGFAALLSDIGRVVIEHIKIILIVRTDLVWQKRHWEWLVGSLRATAIAAIPAIIVFKPLFQPAQRAGFVQ